jgi:hypothetical protein
MSLINRDICLLKDVGNSVAFQDAVGSQGLVSTPIKNKWVFKNDNRTITYCVARGSNDIVGDSIERWVINLAFTSWGLDLNLKFKSVSVDDPHDFDIRWVSKKEDPYFTSDSILAYCGYPQTKWQGILRFNDDVIWTPDGSDLSSEELTKLTGRPSIKGNRYKTYNINQTARHEIGHGLGAVHKEDCRDCIMYPYYNNTLFPTDGDLKLLEGKYGRRIYKSDKIKQNLRNAIQRDTMDWKGKWKLNI